MDLCQIIEDAKCCSAKMAAAYVKAVSVGEDTEVMYYELVEMRARIKSLKRFDPKPSKPAAVNTGEFILDDTTNKLSLKSKTIALDPSVNCLAQDDICKIIQQISLVCDDCSCNC